ncbi:MAG: hypothetical protein ABW007_00600 [Chitinophagaceae bacterium]
MSTNFTPDQWEEYYNEHPIPEKIQLDSGAFISNPKQFLSTQIALLRHYGDTAMQGKLCRDRLVSLKEIMEKQGK